jgi:hypothetical protein
LPIGQIDRAESTRHEVPAVEANIVPGSRRPGNSKKKSTPTLSAVGVPTDMTRHSIRYSALGLRETRSPGPPFRPSAIFLASAKWCVAISVVSSMSFRNSADA